MFYYINSNTIKLKKFTEIEIRQLKSQILLYYIHISDIIRTDPFILKVTELTFSGPAYTIRTPWPW